MKYKIRSIQFSVLKLKCVDFHTNKHSYYKQYFQRYIRIPTSHIQNPVPVVDFTVCRNSVNATAILTNSTFWNIRNPHENSHILLIKGHKRSDDDYANVRLNFITCQSYTHLHILSNIYMYLRMCTYVLELRKLLRYSDPLKTQYSRLITLLTRLSGVAN